MIIFLSQNPASCRRSARCFSGRGSASHAAEATITVDAKTGFILDKFQADKKRQVGSLTKIATAMVVLDWAAKQGGDLAQVAIVPDGGLRGASENNVGLQPGDTVTIRDLLYAALVQSDNIAAYTLADHVGRALAGQSAGQKRDARAARPSIISSCR